LATVIISTIAYERPVRLDYMNMYIAILPEFLDLWMHMLKQCNTICYASRETACICWVP
jgi:hypothetical protein